VVINCITLVNKNPYFTKRKFKQMENKVHSLLSLETGFPGIKSHLVGEKQTGLG
jgi:hypothetical protein